MANQVLTNCGLWVGEYNLAGDANALALGVASELQDDTALADTARSRTGGLQTVAFSAEGIWHSDGDAVLWNDVGLSDVPVTIAPGGPNVGDRAFIARCTMAEFRPLEGAVGELRRFAVGGEGQSIARGALLHNATRTATGSAPAGVQLGAMVAGQAIHAALHVLAAAGTTPSLTVRIESDDNPGFTTPTTQLTFTAATAVGAQWALAAAVTADTWWRVAWTIAGTGPSFAFVVSAGIR